MRSRPKRIGVFLTLGLLAGLLVVPHTARAQATVNVQVGGFLGEGTNVPSDSMRFFVPDGALSVHAGDTVNFGFQGFHTATLLPANTDAEQWVADNTGGLDKPWSIVVADPDDVGEPGSSAAKPPGKFNNAVGFPTDPTCGADPTTPCDYDGTSVLNSGAFGGPTFAATINANPGDTIWVVCLIHPNMRMQINVVADTEPTTTQAEIDAYQTATFAADKARAAAKHRQLVDMTVKRRVGGKVVWRAFAGFDAEGYALIAMYPRTLPIKKGHFVKFRFDKLIYEDHTVTFPKSRAREIFRNDFLPGCDPDGDAGPGPDNPPDTQEPPFCNDPTQLELDISAFTIHKHGDNKIRSTRDFATSGVRGHAALNFDPYQLKFTRRSDRKGYKYMCLIHGPFQSGKVVVR